MTIPIEDPVKVIEISDNISVGLFPDGKIMTMIHGKPFIQCRKAILILKREGDLAERLGEYENMDDFLFGRTRSERLLDKTVIDEETELFVHASNIQAWVDSGYNIDVIDTRIAFPILIELAKTDRAARDALFFEVERRWKEGSEASRTALGLHLEIRPIIDMIDYREGKVNPGLMERMAKNTFAPPGLLVKLASSEDASTRMYVASNPSIPKAAWEKLSRDADVDVLVELSKNHSVPKPVRESVIVGILPEKKREFVEGNFDDREVIIDFFLDNADIPSVERVTGDLLSVMVSELVDENPVAAKIDYIGSLENDYSGLEMAVFGQYYKEYSGGKSPKDFEKQVVDELVEGYNAGNSKDYTAAPGKVMYKIIGTGKARVEDLTQYQVWKLIDHLETARGEVYRKHGIVGEEDLKRLMPEYKFVRDNFTFLYAKAERLRSQQLSIAYPKLYAEKILKRPYKRDVLC